MDAEELTGRGRRALRGWGVKGAEALRVMQRLWGDPVEPHGVM